MMKAKKLRQHPAKFPRLSGLTVEQFDHLIREVAAAYPHFHRRRLMHQERQREVGGGRAFHLTLEDRVLLLLVWLRLYLTNELLGYLFALDASNISRNLRLVLPLCAAHLPTPFQPARQLAGRKPEKAPLRRRKIGTIEELLRKYPDLRDVIVDATEQPIERPSDKRVQKKHYSGKKKRHTRKTQLSTLPNGMIVHVSKSVPGRVHDYKLWHRSGVDRAVPPDYGLRVDQGYQGIVTDYPHRSVAIPVRASKLHPLTRAQKQANRGMARARIGVEHTIGRVKKYRVIGSVYRHRREDYDPVMRVVCGLVNFRTQDRLAASV